MRRPLALVSLLLLASLILCSYFWVRARRGGGDGGGDGRSPGVSGGKELAAAPPADEASIRGFCSLHHADSPPEIFEKRVWVKEVDRMYRIAGAPLEGMPGIPPRDGVLAYYQERAQETLPPVRGQGHVGPGSLKFRKATYAPPGAPPTPAVAQVRLVRLLDPARPDLLYCDMRHGQVALQRLDQATGTAYTLLARVPHPCRAEPVDLDRDGILDLLVADLGSFDPYDHQRGAIVWLRGSPGGKFTALNLAEGLGRVADVQAADLDGDGDLDLAAAVFGWRLTGEVLLLLNRTSDWSRPSFEKVVLDPRPGAIHATIADLDRDGRKDIVVLLAQQFEAVEVFLGRQSPQLFEKRTVWQAPHPAWGCSSMDLADLDADGDLDVILASGDTLDHSQLVPWQGVRWLENRGKLPFKESLFEQLPGCHRALPVDLDGDGDLDIAACAFLPQFPADRARLPLDLESVIWLEQTSRGKFARRSVESHFPDYPTLDAGDLDGDGDVDLVVGLYALSPEKLGTIPAWTAVFLNESRPAGAPR